MSQNPGGKPVRYLNDVLHIKLHIKGQFNVVFGEDALLRLAAAAQATEGTGVARGLLVDAAKKKEEVLVVLRWNKRAVRVLVCCWPQLHDRSEEHSEERWQTRDVGHDGGVSK